MRIALFSDTYLPEINGVAMSTANLRNTLIAHGHEVIVVCTNPYSKKVTFEDGLIRVPGIQLKWLYGYRMAWIYNRKAAKIVKDFKPDIIHVQTDFGIAEFGFHMSRKLKIPAIYTFHTCYEDYTYYIDGGHFDRFVKGFVRWYVRMLSNKWVKGIIAPSEKIKDYLRNMGIDGSVDIAPTGIEFNRFAWHDGDKEAAIKLREEYGIAEDEFVILSLGRVAKEKSIDVCLRGYADYLNNGGSSKTRFVVVGGGPALDDLKKLARDLGIEEKTVFVGPVKPTETQYYYHLGDVFVSASLTETQGLTFMEAMAANLVVLARYDDNLKGTIKDGETGFFFYEEEDFKRKLDKIIKLKKGERKAILKAAEEANEPYSMERFYQNVTEVYRRAIKKNW